MKTIYIGLIAMAFLLVFVIISGTAFSSEDYELVSFVIVMDDSGSMRGSDPEELALDGAKLFIDLLPAGKANISVVVYGRGAVTVVPLMYAKSASEKEIIKNALADNISYRQGLSDYGSALDMAVNNLMEAGSEKAAILLFTDGNLKVDERDEETVESQLVETIIFCSDRGWPIYTIGLNFDETADDLRLEEISLGTGAGNPLITREPQELSTFFTEIFKRYYKNIQPRETIDVKEGDALYNIKIPEMVLETSIVINGVGPDTSTILKNPNGQVIEFDDELYRKYEGDTYNVIKLVEPNSGEWTIEITGLGYLMDTISIQSLNVVDLPAVLEVSSEQIYINKPVLLEAYLLYKGEKVIDEDYYNETETAVYVKNVSSNEIRSYPMTFCGLALCNEIIFEDIGEYIVNVKIVTPYFERESSEIKILVRNRAPIIKKHFEDLDLKIGDDYQLDMADYFNDPDNNALGYESIISDQSIILADIRQEVLYLDSLGQVGEVSVNLSATDSEGEKVNQGFRVRLKNTPPVIEKQIEKVILIVGEENTVNLESYFSDPDGFPFTVQIAMEDEGNCIVWEYTDNTLYIKGVESGKVVLELVMIDSADDSIEMSGEILVLTVRGYWWRRFWYLPLIIVAATIFGIFISRRVKGALKVQIQINGKWLESYEVATGSQYVQNPDLRKSKFKLKSLLDVYSPMTKWFDGKEISGLMEAFDTTKVTIISPLIGGKVKVKAENGIYIINIDSNENEKMVKSCYLKNNDSAVIVLNKTIETNIKLTYLKR